MRPPRWTIDVLAPFLEARFDRSGGPGGQNVNKVSTRVTLLLDFAACPAFDDAQRERIRQRCATRLSADGRLRVVAQQSRSQSANREHAEQRLLELLETACHVREARVPTRKPRAAVRRRLTDKKLRGEKKQQRSWRGGEG